MAQVLQRSCFARNDSLTCFRSYVLVCMYVQNSRCLVEFGRCLAVYSVRNVACVCVFFFFWGGGGHDCRNEPRVMEPKMCSCDLATRSNPPFMSTWNEHKKLPVGSAENFKSNLSSVSAAGEEGVRGRWSGSWLTGRVGDFPTLTV